MVNIHCSRGHDYELTESMIIPGRGGKIAYAACPVCKKSSILATKAIAETLGFKKGDGSGDPDVHRARDWLQDKWTDQAMKSTPSQNESSDTQDVPADVPAEVSSTNESKPSGNKVIIRSSKFIEDPENGMVRESGPVKKESKKQMPKKSAKMKKKVTVDDIPQDDESGGVEETDQTSGRIPSLYINEDELEESANEILMTTLDETPYLDDDSAAELKETFTYSLPVGLEAWSPNDVSRILQDYGLTKMQATRIANKYEWSVRNWQAKKAKLAQRGSLFNSPSNTIPQDPSGFRQPGAFIPQPGVSHGSAPQVPGYNQYGYTPGYQPQYQFPINDPNQMAQISQMYQQLQQNPAMMQAFAQMMGMQPPNPYASPFGETRGRAPSRDEIKRMITSEVSAGIEQLRAPIQQLVQSNSGNNQNNTVMQLMAEMMKSERDRTTALMTAMQQQNQQPVQHKPDPSQEMLHRIADKLISDKIDSAGRPDPAIQQLVDEVKSLKNADAGGSSGLPRSVDEWTKFIEVNKLMSDIDFRKREFETGLKEREETRELIKDALTTGLPSVLSTVMAIKGGGGGGSIPQSVQSPQPQSQPQAVQAPAYSRTDETITQPCISCGAPITFPIGASRVICGRCGKVLEVVQQTRTDNQQQQLPIQQDDIGEDDNEVYDAVVGGEDGVVDVDTTNESANIYSGSVI